MGEEKEEVIAILDFDGDLYDAEMEVDFIERIRGEMAFAGPDALRDQIKADTDTARGMLKR